MKKFFLLGACLLTSLTMMGNEHVNYFKSKGSFDDITGRLTTGNENFIKNTPTHQHNSIEMRELAAKENQAKYAFATILSCADSRVPVELIFDCGIMDLFVVRIAGNVLHRDGLGCIEYGVMHVNTPLVIVMGHTQCGAVSAVEHQIHGDTHGKLEKNIPTLVEPIVPICQNYLKNHPESSCEEFINCATVENVYANIRNLLNSSAAVRNEVQQGNVKVLGAIYHLEDGKVEFLPQENIDKIFAEVLDNPTRSLEVYAAGDASNGDEDDEEEDED